VVAFGDFVPFLVEGETIVAFEFFLDPFGRWLWRIDEEIDGNRNADPEIFHRGLDVRKRELERS
jgi:hypothetical protein